MGPAEQRTETPLHTGEALPVIQAPAQSTETPRPPERNGPKKSARALAPGATSASAVSCRQTRRARRVTAARARGSASRVPRSGPRHAAAARGCWTWHGGFARVHDPTTSSCTAHGAPRRAFRERRHGFVARADGFVDRRRGFVDRAHGVVARADGFVDYRRCVVDRGDRVGWSCTLT